MGSSNINSICLIPTSLLTFETTVKDKYFSYKWNNERTNHIFHTYDLNMIAQGHINRWFWKNYAWLQVTSSNDWNVIDHPVLDSAPEALPLASECAEFCTAAAAASATFRIKYASSSRILICRFLTKVITLLTRLSLMSKLLLISGKYKKMNSFESRPSGRPLAFSLSTPLNDLFGELPLEKESDVEVLLPTASCPLCSRHLSNWSVGSSWQRARAAPGCCCGKRYIITISNSVYSTISSNSVYVYAECRRFYRFRWDRTRGVAACVWYKSQGCSGCALYRWLERSCCGILDHAVLNTAQQLFPIVPLDLVLKLEEEVVDGACVREDDLELADERVRQRNLRMLVSDHVAEELNEFSATVHVTGFACWPDAGHDFD